MEINALITKSKDELKYVITKKMQGQFNFKMNDELHSFHLVNVDDPCASDVVVRYKGKLYALGFTSMLIFTGTAYWSRNHNRMYYLSSNTFHEIKKFSHDSDRYEDLISTGNLHHFSSLGVYFVVRKNKPVNWVKYKMITYSMSYNGQDWTDDVDIIPPSLWNRSDSYVCLKEPDVFELKGKLYVVAEIVHTDSYTHEDHYAIGLGTIEGYGTEVKWMNRPDLPSYEKYEGFYNTEGRSVYLCRLNDSIIYYLSGDHVVDTIYSINLNTLEYKVLRKSDSRLPITYKVYGNRVMFQSSGKIYETYDGETVITTDKTDFDPEEEYVNRRLSFFKQSGEPVRYKITNLLDGSYVITDRWKNKVLFDPSKDIKYNIFDDMYYFVHYGFLYKTYDFKTLVEVTRMPGENYMYEEIANACD